MHSLLFTAVLFILFLFTERTSAQLSYGASAVFGLTKIVPSYSGNAIQIRRACDNATVNIGFNACGNLDTAALNAFAGLQNFPLSSITTAAATAFSLRKVNCSYAGSAIRIRSTAVGTPTFDIGFTVNGDLDTTTMKTFIGSNSAYVTIWYDQSGNGRNATSIVTGTNQPRIMLSGIIERQGNKPAIRFLGANNAGRGFATANLNIYGTAACFNGVVKVNTDLTYNTFLNLSNSNFPNPLDHYNGTIVIGNGSSTYSFYSPSQSLNASYPNGIWTYQAGGVTAANIRMWHNGTSILTGGTNSSSYGNVSRPLYIGTRDDYLTNLDGWMSEAITFSVIPSNTDRNFLEWTQSSYYNISGGNSLGTLPAGTLPSAFVMTWYDQSGSAKNLSQLTNANQPRIVNTGVVDKQNSIPAIYFNGSSNYLSASDAGLPTSDLSISAIVRSNAASYGSPSYGSFLHYGAAGSGNAVFATYGTDGNMGTNAVSISQYSDALGITNSLGASLIYTTSRLGNNYSLWKNGGSAAFRTMTSNTTLFGTDGMCVGSFNATLGGSYLNGYISELSIYPTSFSSTRRILLESNRSAYTGIAVINNKYTPPAAGSYNLYVNGIGRESATDTVLGTRVTVGMGIKSGMITGTDFLQSDGDYLTYGINCPLTPGTSTLNLPGTIVERWRNDWYIYKTDVGTTGGNIKIYFDFSDYLGGFMPGAVANYELMYRNSSSGTFAIVAGTTKSIAGDRVEFDLNSSGVSNGYYTIGTKNAITSPLPIELLYFAAVPNGNQVDISWATATESNNDYFTIEKSDNGVNFLNIKTVKSKGTNGNSVTQLNYTDVDMRPYSGTSYYRLKQTDFNAIFKYSNIVDVTFDQSSEKDILVYPNPNEGQFTLNFKGFKALDGGVQIIILDALGKKVYDQTLVLTGDLNAYQITPSEKISKGFYFMSCIIDGITYAEKVVVN
ncbi:MAG: T9SS type A sorting domain-containing protein [Bacteroidota bacterium]